MRVLSSFIFFAAVIVGAANAETQLPKRKAGLWEVKITSQTQAGTQVAKHCIDEATDAKMQQMASSIGQNCSKMENRQEGQKYISEAACKIMGTNVTSKAVFSGDFGSNYSGEIAASYDPPLMGMKESKTTVSARWLGACEAGQKPGDIIMGNGMKMNINDLQMPKM